MKKKILSVAIATVIVILAIASVSLAYLTDKEEKENTFTVGNVDIELTEPKWDEVGKAEAEDAYPGEALAKDPTVENIGKNPCFVRVKVTGLDMFCEKYEDDGMIIYRTDYEDGKLGDNWYLHTDGYFYYTKVLAVGEKTDALFDQIVIPAVLTNEDSTKASDAPYSIDVYAEAVQAQGARPSFTAVEAMTVEEIAAWFATCMPDAQN